MKKALLIVGHGSKSTDAVDTFDQIVELVKKKSAYDITAGAHMELADLSIEKSVKNLAEQAVTHITIIPYFLYAGQHIKKDIPAIIDNLSKIYPEIQFKFGKPIGYEPVIADILIKRALEAENL